MQAHCWETSCCYWLSSLPSRRQPLQRHAKIGQLQVCFHQRITTSKQCRYGEHDWAASKTWLARVWPLWRPWRHSRQRHHCRRGWWCWKQTCKYFHHRYLYSNDPPTLQLAGATSLSPDHLRRANSSACQRQQPIFYLSRVQHHQISCSREDGRCAQGC